MMAQLNRSRPTIREALRMLEQGGYIASTHGAPGAVVQEPSLHGVEEPLAEMIQLNQISLQELGEYRLNNDSTIAMWAAQRRSAADLQQLRQCLQEAQASLEDYEHFVDLDVKFHSLLAQATATASPSSSRRCSATSRRRRCAGRCSPSPRPTGWRWSSEF